MLQSPGCLLGRGLEHRLRIVLNRADLSHLPALHLKDSGRRPRATDDLIRLLDALEQLLKKSLVHDVSMKSMGAN